MGSICVQLKVNDAIILSPSLRGKRIKLTTSSDRYSWWNILSLQLGAASEPTIWISPFHHHKVKSGDSFSFMQYNTLIVSHNDQMPCGCFTWHHSFMHWVKKNRKKEKKWAEEVEEENARDEFESYYLHIFIHNFKLIRLYAFDKQLERQSCRLYIVYLVSYSRQDL